jgi:hypothetical protein
MCMTRLSIYLDDLEFSALAELADSERRSTRDQAALILRRELEQLGWLAPSHPAPTLRREPQATLREVDHAAQ